MSAVLVIRVLSRVFNPYLGSGIYPFINVPGEPGIGGELLLIFLGFRILDLEFLQKILDFNKNSKQFNIFRNILENFELLPNFCRSPSFWT